MTLEQADHIRMDWGKYLEITQGSLMVVFLGKIPQCFLPYSKETITEALNIIAKHFSDNGNVEAVETIKATVIWLECYVEDSEALKNASNNFNNEKYLKAILPGLSNQQDKLLKYVVENY